MPRHASITIRLFLMLLVLISSIFGSIYWFTVPLIKENVFGLELHANRQVLNVVYDLANRMYASTETYVDKTLNSHEQRLQSVLDVAEKHIEVSLRDGRKAGLSESEIWSTIFSDLREFDFGNGDYIWVADYNARLLSHPAEEFHQRDMSDFLGPDGQPVMPNILGKVREDQQGFYKYKWQRLDNKKVIEKYSYVKDLSKWEFIMGAGVYIDDIQEEVALQKQQAILEINKALKNIKIASNGYLYVFDSKGNMLFHPNPNIHGINFKKQLNPVTQNPIYLDLMGVADTGRELYYKWDRPDDQGNYEYEKLSLVRHLSGFDWYISSSVYLDDLKESSVQLSQRIMATGFFGLLAAIVIAFLFAEWLTQPIKKLSLTAYKISRGNHSAKTGISRNDELGLLAESFDYMVDQLRDNISSLNSRVKARTKELSESNFQLRDAVSSMEKAQTELREVETRQRLILNELPAQVAYLDKEQKFIFANREYLNMFGQRKGEIEGKTLEEVVGDEMYREIKPHIEHALEGDVEVYEYLFQLEDRDMLTRRTVLPFYNENKQVVGFLNLSIDITHERETERRLAEASKMKAVGQMSGGLAHDFNNLLTIILGNLRLLQQHHLLPKELQENLDPAIRATRRGADMTKRLLAFSRRQPLSPARIEPGSLISELVDLLVAPLPENIELSTEIKPETPDVYVDAAQMEDALVNLALNSVDAMPNGGELRLTVSGVDCSAQDVVCDEFDEAVRPGHYVLISVTDNGQGFTDEALSKAYEPFFTTKSTGAGSGLGLSMVYGFVKQSKGYLRIRNRCDIESNLQGSQIDILLPEATGTEVKHVPVFRSDELSVFPTAQTTALVLLVEDNLDVRKLVRSQLTDLGFAVLEASTGDEALSLLVGIEELAGLVSDVVMPGTNSGYDVAAQVRAQHSSAFIVLMTGYTENPPETDFEFKLLQKPFDACALEQAISPELDLSSQKIAKKNSENSI
ncbi:MULTISPECIES: cache domain-containing protein [unclassified Neptuniibacter]|uniref:cache domain-containing protein n=1 Tax=unclassified Neptuniibacter TaxID=2630693 RepID=UPI000C39B696|nr:MULTISPECIES: cache domain-containing protein [unclassified Neptuniibacter]MAY41636.1 PAS sensor protein [Oceanospirillaceae bacterium]|tara:strand:+ start:14247 stop:17165 length:2919 start_codon:yes stop_codon:yes gene_type:complete